ncbi:MAG: ACP S-malonyltransferase [Deltaproteobacteria bacterium]|nr:ACP S-malonyltransferase [Deltaproteobacteria bacterium]
MSRTAFMFPGQGGQFVGMGKEWAETSSACAEYFHLADKACGRSISKLCFEGPAEELGRTENLQAAALAVGLAAAERLRAGGAAPEFAAGHSLGEFGALVLAGVLEAGAAFELVAKRSELMARAAEGGGGAMAAILNLDPDLVEGLCELARHEGVVVAANFNSPQQTVVSGEARAVAACALFAEKKGGRSVPLPVTGAFHSPLMARPAEIFAGILDETPFQKPRFPVVPNALGETLDDPAEIKKHLKLQMTSPVLWTKTVAGLAAAGVDNFLECWPRAYVGPMIRKTLGPAVKARIGSAKE